MKYDYDFFSRAAANYWGYFFFNSKNCNLRRHFEEVSMQQSEAFPTCQDQRYHNSRKRSWPRYSETASFLSCQIVKIKTVSFFLSEHLPKRNARIILQMFLMQAVWEAFLLLDDWTEHSAVHFLEEENCFQLYGLGPIVTGKYRKCLVWEKAAIFFFDQYLFRPVSIRKYSQKKKIPYIFGRKIMIMRLFAQVLSVYLGRPLTFYLSRSNRLA